MNKAERAAFDKAWLRWCRTNYVPAHQGYITKELFTFAWRAGIRARMADWRKQNREPLREGGA